MEELIRPNWHIAIVHFPIALIVLGAILELFSFLGWRRTSLRSGARWMLLAGAILAVPAAFSGIYALANVVPHRADLVPNGIESLRATDPILADYLWWHLWTQAGATVLAMLIVTVWIGLSDGWRDRLSIVFKFLLLVLVALIGYGSHVGGQQVYEHQLATEKRMTPATLPSTTQLADVDTWATLFPPDQNHVTLAGLAMAAACVCIGLAARGTHYEDLNALRAEGQFTSAFVLRGDEPIVQRPQELYVSPTNHTPAVRVGRIWTLAWLLLVLTAVSGLAILAIDAHSIDWGTIWDSISKPIEQNDPSVTRRFAHLIIGVVIVVDSLVLALLSRFARRRATVLAMFALPLILAMAAQIWLGVLLLLDGPSGPVTRFLH